MTARYSSNPCSEQSQLQTRRYHIREKTFSLGDSFKIADELGKTMFNVRSKILSIGDHLIVEDSNGNGLIKIRQEVLHLLPTFHIMSAADGDSERSLAHIKQKFTFLHKKFVIDSVYGQYKLEAVELQARSFTLTKGDRNVAHISKNPSNIGSAYSISIAADENQEFVLALVIVLNQVLFTIHWQTFTVLR